VTADRVDPIQQLLPCHAGEPGNERALGQIPDGTAQPLAGGPDDDLLAALRTTPGQSAQHPVFHTQDPRAGSMWNICSIDGICVQLRCSPHRVVVPAPPALAGSSPCRRRTRRGLEEPQHREHTAIDIRLFGYTELAEQSTGVLFDGPFTDIQRPCNGGIGLSRRHLA